VSAAPLVLEREDVVGWTPRFPPLVLRLLTGAVAVALVVVAMVQDAVRTTFPLTAAVSAGEGLGLVAVGTWCAAVVLVRSSPTAAPWVVVLGGALNLLGSPARQVPTAPLVALVGLALVVGILGWAQQVDQRASARRWQTARRDTHAPVTATAHADVPYHVVQGLGGTRTDLTRWATLALCVGLVLLGAAVYLHDSSRSRALLRQGEPLLATVVSQDEEPSEVVLDLGGVRVTAVTDYARLAPGAQVPVLRDPATGRVEMIDNAFDPTGSLLLLGAGAAGALAWSGRTLRRRRQAATWAVDGVTTVRVTAGWRGHGLDLSAAHAHGEPFASLAGVFAWGSEVEDREDDGLGALRVRSLVVDVVGLTQHGDPVAFRDAEGRWYGARVVPAKTWRDYLPSGPATSRARHGRGEWPARGLPGAVVRRESAAPDEDGALRRGARRVRRARRALGAWTGELAWRTAVATVHWLPWLSALLLYVGSRWMGQDLGLLHVGGLVLGAIFVAPEWFRTGRPPLALRRDRLLVLGAVLAERYLPAQVARASVDGRALVVDVEGPDGDERALRVSPGLDQVPLLRGARSSEEAAAMLGAWCTEAARTGVRVGAVPVGRAPRTLRRVPTAGAMCGVLWSVAIVAGYLAGR